MFDASICNGSTIRIGDHLLERNEIEKEKGVFLNR
jgi:hypothetical protein